MRVTLCFIFITAYILVILKPVANSLMIEIRYVFTFNNNNSNKCTEVYRSICENILTAS